MEMTVGNAMHNFCEMENTGVPAAAALEELSAGACAVGVVPNTVDVLLDEVEVADAVVLVVDVVFGCGSSSSPSR